MTPAEIRRWVRAILVVFLMMGLSFGTWLSRLPGLRDGLSASTLEMSIYGLCLAAGSLAGMFVAARLLERFGARRIMLVLVLVQLAALPGAIALMLGGFLGAGVAVLFVYGGTFSVTDIAMNVSGAAAERALGRPRLPLMHACYSIGTMIAMGIGAAAEALRVSLPLHILAVMLVVCAGSLSVLRWVPASALATTETAALPPSTGAIAIVPNEAATAGATDSRTRAAATQRYQPWRDRRVLLIGTITLTAGILDGAAADWLPLSLVDGRGVSNEFGAVMLGVFFGAVVTSRLLGSVLLSRFSRVTVLRSSLIGAMAGILVLLLVPSGAGMLLGTLLWGLGTGVCWPLTISAAADRQETAARDVAAVSAIGYTSMLLGPMAFGVLGEHIGLLTAFWVLPVLALAALAISGVVRQNK